MRKPSLVLLTMLLACEGAGSPERVTLESTDSAVVNGNQASVFPPPTGSQSSPAVAFDGTSHLVVWSDARGGAGQDLHGARVSAAGVLLDPAPLVISAGPGDEITAAVAFDGTNYLVVWQDQRGSTGRDVYGARVSPDGTVLDPGGIAISTAAEHQVEPAVAFDGTSYLVVWEDRRGGLADVRGARVSPNGSVLASELLISGAPLHQTQPAVACASGACLVAWRDGRAGGPDVYGARVAGASVVDAGGLPISRAGSSQGRPAVASDGSGYLVVWNDTRSGTSDVYGSRVGADGQILDLSGLAITAEADAQQSPEVAFEGAYYVVAWHDRRSGVAFDAHAARVTPAGAVVDPSGFLVGTGAAGTGTSVASDGAGRVLVAFGGLHSLDALTTVTRVRTQAITIRAELAVSLIGNGAGSVASEPAGIACGDACAAMFDAPTVVTLTPSAAPGSEFVGWSGACSQAGLGPCTLTVDESRLAIARFSPLYPLTVARTGLGTGEVISNPAGIVCGATCTAQLVEGTLVTLSATPGGTSVFAGWSGACSGMETCVVAMDAAQDVTASFLPGYRLAVSTTGGSAGTVSGGSTGPVGAGTISCSAGSTAGCSAVVATGDGVTLRAAPGQDAVFKGWTGGCTGLGDCTFAMSSAKNVTASFQPATYEVKVTLSGGGAGSVAGEGISCTTTGTTTICATAVANTTPYKVLTLTAAPDADSILKAWYGCSSTSGNACTITVSGPRNVTASIQPSKYLLSVSSAGTYGGGGTVAGPGIDCTTGSTTGCSAPIDNGATVTLTATPNASSIFKRWTGCSSYSGATCTVSMTNARSVTAAFEPAQYALTVSATEVYGGTGTVTGPGIACSPGATTGCSAPIANGETVTLTATPNAGAILKRWTGCSSYSGATCTVSMSSARSVTAAFEPAEYALTVSATESYGGTGTVTGPGIACSPGATTGCSAPVANGGTVTLVAEPAPGSLFKSWVGCSSTSGASCTVTLSTPRTVTATFMPSEYPLAVTLSGTYGASGSVSGPGISCTADAASDCSTAVANGATVTLVAEPAPGSIFKSWVGCSSTSGAACTVTLSSPRTVTASFAPSEFTLTVTASAIYGANGTITGPGLSCTPGASTGCTTAVANGATVSLVAEPAPGSVFKSWTGCSSTSGAVCSITMTAARSATAAFQPDTYQLTVTTSGTGQGSVDGAGIACSTGATAGCTASVEAGATVTLTATPRTACDTFTGWGGGSCSGTGPCNVTMTMAKTVTAAFGKSGDPLCAP
ncbi:cell wall/surface repeat-containing protein [Anaeromyxobacter sp. Fw109-5]|uniref:InlB B-repeat-containing protein n=1 Tax=Anaeromyxobacter sp. (strain Fw109-5) TaxID=404589 RepID=UPI0000ED762A|nr:cell wall/surface repeat-containing protein [Anaeromyxobacter sp. Fw109-5]ABS25884.1 cell wall/surface repeat protein [Anaeromyxobacter sp. Fw109-5]